MLYQERDEEKRADFSQVLANLDQENIVWVDECGLNQDLIRLYGRCPRHQRLYGEHSGQRVSPRISMIAAYCDDRLCAPFRFNGYTDSQIFNLWLGSCLLPLLKPGQVVIMDNATFHKSTTTRDLIEDCGCQLLFLPLTLPISTKLSSNGRSSSKVFAPTRLLA